MEYEIVCDRDKDGMDVWISERLKRMTGTDAGVVQGNNHWCSKAKLFAIKRGIDSGPEESEAMYWGTTLEDVVLEQIQKEHPDLVTSKENVPMIASLKYPWMSANPDMVAEGRLGKLVLEAKTCGHWSSKEWNEGKVPERYIDQVHHYMAVLGEEYQGAIIGCLIGGQKFVSQFIPRDPVRIQAIIKNTKEFWAVVESGDPLSLIDDSDDVSETLEKIYEPKETEEPVQLEGEGITQLLAIIKSAKMQEQVCQKERKGAENKLKAMLGHSTVGQHGDTYVKWEPSERSSFDSKDFRKDHPDLFEKYQKTIVVRPFRILTSKKEN